MNGIRLKPLLHRDVRSIGSEFQRWLASASKRHRRPNRAHTCWEIILKVCKPGFDDETGRQNYEAAFNEWKTTLPHKRSSSSEPKALFRSAIQQAAHKASEWQGYNDGAVTYGLKLVCRGSVLCFDTEIRKPIQIDIEAEEQVQMFYKAVSTRSWLEAWDCLDLPLQTSRWKGNFTRFVDGYADMDEMRNLQLLTRVALHDYYVVDAFFEEERHLPVIPALSKWIGLTFGQLRSNLSSLVDELHEEFQRLGVQESRFNSLPVKKLFHADALLAVPWELEISSIKIDSVYPNREPVTLHIARRVVMRKSNNRWLIADIRILSA